MSIGRDWKERLDASVAQQRVVTEAAQVTAAEQRARETIMHLKKNLEKAKEHRCLVMALYHNESTVPDHQLRNKQYTSSKLFLGAAKTVVDYCLTNDLDVYVWEEDFRMSSGEIGAEIWVTPRGVPYHP